ncbi:serine hydrolase domain-containing protein [Kribbella sp. NPDC003557]|uniref:serine hydrolase domain-containing protein n=1 Tax=Kribbella sp. NPDC003557 TaxID=3154449 RepID=UPI0033AB9F47
MSKRMVAELQRYVAGLVDEHKVPGLAVGICDADSVLWCAGFGCTRADGDVAISAETMFSVQSCSKMYTATAVMLAVQDGLVELDAPVPRYLPEFRVNSSFEKRPERLITLRHLLSHTAGFTHEAPVGSNYRIGRASFETHCRSICDTWLRFPVGERYEYSNLGIDLAGYILQRRSGMPFHEYVRRELLAPLGLQRTTFDAKMIRRDTSRATGHSRGYTRLPVRIPVIAAGGLYTTAEDACRYIQFHLRGGESLLSPELLQEMYAGQQYGLGIAIADANGVPVRGHGGGGFGFLSDMYWAPTENLGVVVLTNSTDHPLQWQLTTEIFSRILGGSSPPPEPAPAKPVAPEISGEVDGPWNREYAIHVGSVRDGTARLRKENGALFFDHWGGETVRLQQHRPGLYISTTGEVLDLTTTPPTYANIRLHELKPAK